MRDELLALLEDGPKTSAQLAAWLDQPEAEIKRQLRAIAKEALVRRVGVLQRWALANFQTQNGRPPSIGRTAPRRPVEDRVERLLRIEEPAPEGDAVCERCGGRFMRKDGTAGRFCSRDCYERPAPPVSVTRIIDGQEYEAISIGAHPLTAWPDGTSSGSSLSGRTFPVKTS